MKNIDLDQVVAAFGNWRLPVTTVEEELQEAIRQVLIKSGIPFTREKVFDHRSRVDFLTVSGVAIEVKVAGSVASVITQLYRYSEYAEVTAVLLVTTKSRHRVDATEMSGKPVRVFLVRSEL